jgi:cytochrome c-type biogenesis protein CcmH
MNVNVGASVSRRGFLTRCAVTAPVLLAAPSLLRAQSSATVDMEGDYYLPVRPPAKPNPTVQLDEDAVMALERTLACPCPCTLDIYTCRTTDVTCGNSPAIHGDIVRMVNGGYTGDEIVAELNKVYGQRIMASPKKSGFSLMVWFMPFAVVGTGALVIAALVRSWRKNAVEAAALSSASGVRSIGVQATEDEMARLNAALRDDSR